MQAEREAKATFCERWIKQRGFAFWVQLSHCRRVVFSDHEHEDCWEGAQEQISAQIWLSLLPNQLLALGQTRQCLTSAPGGVVLISGRGLELVQERLVPPFPPLPSELHVYR